jgi:PAB1-binding protein PBP1
MDDEDLYSGLVRGENCFNLDNSTSKRRNITQK